MAKKIRVVLTLQLPAGKATPAPPVGTALGPHINVVEFCKSYNEKTAGQVGQVIPAQITIYEDRSFTFVLKTPAGRGPAPQGRRHRGGLGDARPRFSVGTVTRAQVREIAQDEDGRPQRDRPRRGAAALSRARRAPWVSRSSASTPLRAGRPDRSRRARAPHPVRTPRVERGGRHGGREGAT